MKRRFKININRIYDSLNKAVKHNCIDEKLMNRLFYYSLIDSTSAFEADNLGRNMFGSLYPDRFFVNRRKFITRIFKKCSGEDEYLKNLVKSSSINDFLRIVVDSDMLTKVILRIVLNNNGFTTKTISKSSRFDLYIKIKGKNIPVEIKRVSTWYEYADYISNSIKKSKSVHKCLVLILSPRVGFIEHFFGDSKTEMLSLFDEYMYNLCRSHYVLEKLLNLPNLRFIIRYIVPRFRKDEYKHTIYGLVDELKRKISEW